MPHCSTSTPCQRSHYTRKKSRRSHSPQRPAPGDPLLTCGTNGPAAIRVLSRNLYKKFFAQRLTRFCFFTTGRERAGAFCVGTAAGGSAALVVKDPCSFGGKALASAV